MQPGDRIAQYEIKGTLGVGGMGVVYAADDTRLQRPVALKFLPRAWSQDDDAKTRFLREARAASGLDHANIYTIYEIGEAPDGGMFIASPRYDGETLKEKIKGGPLSVGDVESISRQLLSALEAAHGASIVHRDVKPANIMVTRAGVVKLLDFGLAKLGADAHLTQEGTTLGTVAYMSPEQATGRPVDHRTDLWSVGVVMYQMLTGELPFGGDYEQAILYSILNAEPDPVSVARSDVPEHITRLVTQLLHKDPRDRISSAREAMDILTAAPVESPREVRKSSKWLVSAAVAAAICVGLLVWMFRPEGAETTPRRIDEVASDTGARASIAVMPFSNLNSDPQTDFLGYALADQIIGALAYVREVMVRPSSSIRPYVGRNYSTRSAGDELAVNYLLNGTYQRQGSEMRLTVELVDVSSDEIIWREPIQLEYDNAFQIQDAVSGKVLSRLQVEFSDVERDHMTFDVPQDPLAYDYYLQAISYPETSDGNRRAIEMLQKALVLDSTYAPAWNAIGFRWQRVGQYDLGGEDPIEAAERAFQTALRINPNLLSALGNLSTLYTDLGRTLEAIRLADRMLKVNPQSPEGHFARGYVLRYVGRTEESVMEMRTALRLDSTYSQFRSAGITFIVAGLLDEAERAFQLDKRSHYAESWTGEVYMRRGQVDEAIKRFDRVVREDRKGLIGLWSLALRSGAVGDFQTGVAAARGWEDLGVVDAEANYYNAAMFCINHDVDSCLRILRRAVGLGYFNVDNFMSDRLLETARKDPRFESVLALARKRQEEFSQEYRP